MRMHFLHFSDLVPCNSCISVNQADTDNIPFQQAVAFVNHTRQHLFLTGKAGTGKTTFLRYIRSVSYKNMVVAAPTGVAAINAGGVTLHSLFQLPFGSFLPTSESISMSDELVHNAVSLLQKVRYNTQKRTLLREMELLVIDEVSMVRADLLDAVDLLLRHTRKRLYEPFGGVQVLFIGDLYQLPPVVQDREWNLLGNYYSTPFFFDAHVIRDNPPLCIELEKIYRQEEPGFIRLLNHIRDNAATEEDLEELNQHYRPGFQPPKEENYIVLTTHNYKANAINERELKELPGEMHGFSADTSGEFSEYAFPADKLLHLKEGAQVMFIKNDKGEGKKYYNGKIGIVHSIIGSRIYISFPGEDEPVLLEKEVWRNIRYTYDENLGEILEDELGTFSQFPVRLAWAVTIHKSQGLTFEKAVVDAGESFAPGQVYVALSRLVSMKGLVLHSRITAAGIRTDPRVIRFMSQKPGTEVLVEVLGTARQEYIAHIMMQYFDWNEMMEAFTRNYQEAPARKFSTKEEAALLAAQLLEHIKKQEATASRFMGQLQKLIPQAPADGYRLLHDRVKAAADYFVPALLSEIIEPLRAHIRDTRKRAKVKRYMKTLDDLLYISEKKMQQVKNAGVLASGLHEGSDYQTLLSLVQEQKKMQVGEPEKNTGKQGSGKGETYIITLEMFRQGKTVDEIATERQMAITTIEGHLAKLVESGDIEITEVVEEPKVQVILAAVQEKSGQGAAAVKSILGSSFSWGEIKAVIAHHSRRKAEQQSRDT